MHSAANAFAGFHGLSAAKLKGSARGALIFTSFGSAWMYWVVVLSGSQTPVWFSIVTLLTVVLTLWSVLRVRAFRHLSSSPAEAEQWMRFRKLFWIDSCIEWGLGGIAVFLLAHIGRSDLIPRVFGVIVGLHFLPLAKVFSAARFYWVGGIMVLAAVGSFIIPRGDVRNVVGCAAIGLIMWLTAVVILRRITWQINPSC